MRRTFLLLLTACMISPLFAAPKTLLSVWLEIKKQGYVQGEMIPCDLCIRNNSARDITFNMPGLSSRIDLTIYKHRIGETRRFLPVDLSHIKPFTVPGGKAAKLPIYINEVADLEEATKYMIEFSAIYNKTAYTGTTFALDIVTGYTLIEGTQLFANAPDLQRSVTLVKWPRNKIDQIFLKFYDTPSNKRFSTQPLGAYLGQEKPRLNIATSGEISVVHKATPDYYVKTTFWSLPKVISRRSRINLLDPSAASAQHLKSIRPDLQEAMRDNDKKKK